MLPPTSRHLKMAKSKNHTKHKFFRSQKVAKRKQLALIKEGTA